MDKISLALGALLCSAKQVGHTPSIRRAAGRALD
jgi:hypothetical protein